VRAAELATSKEAILTAGDVKVRRGPKAMVRTGRHVLKDAGNASIHTAKVHFVAHTQVLAHPVCNRRLNGVYQRRHSIDLPPRLFLIQLDVAGRISSYSGVARSLGHYRMAVTSKLAAHNELVQRLGRIGGGKE
jgi:hypothetical protein